MAKGNQPLEAGDLSRKDSDGPARAGLLLWRYLVSIWEAGCPQYSLVNGVNDKMFEQV